jgi:predicted O-linked N-acetylglucosamine transferase (SPINDLY family)
MYVFDSAFRVARRFATVWRKAGAAGDQSSLGTRFLYAIGLYRIELGDIAGAIRVLNRAAARAPGARSVRFALGKALYQAHQYVDASRHLLGLVRETGHPRAKALLALVLGELGLVAEAEKYAGEAAAAAPDDVLAMRAQVKVLAWRMRYGEAVVLIEHFLASGNQDDTLASWLPYYVTLQPDAEPNDAARAYALAASCLLPAVLPVPARIPRRARTRPRIGYVSGDLKRHPVAQFLEPVLRHHDCSAFDVWVYDNTTSTDMVSKRLRELGHQWRAIVHRDDASTARLIANDGIDMLIDLSGHTEGHRLGVFGRRPAPVQASWLGFPASTGLASMDWRIVDNYTVPCESDFPGTEQPLRLPVVFACFQPQHSAAMPVTATGGPVLGSLHKFEKLNPDVVAVWSRILASEPTARLLIARDEFDPMVARWILGEFKAHGIASERIEVRRLAPGGREFDSALAGIDVLLDAFPWSGHATCSYALAAGVPVLTLAGPTHAGRMVASVLAAAGFNRFIATTRDHYVQLALSITTQVNALREERLARAAAFRQSRACDGAAFTRDLEAAFRSVLG